MKKLPLLFILILTIVGAMGCSSDDACNSLEPMNSDKNALIDMMQMVPEDSEYIAFLDMATMRNDVGLEDAYDTGKSISGGETGVRGMSYDEVAIHGMAGNAMLLRGTLEIDKVRDEYNDVASRDERYPNIDVWSADGYMVALLNKTVTCGFDEYVERCIEVVADGQPSLYDNEVFKAVVDRLPSGFFYIIEKGNANLYNYDGLEVTGRSILRDDCETVSCTWICRFDSEDSILAVIDEIPSDMADFEENWREVKTEQDGLFLKIIAVADTSELFKEQVFPE